MSAYSVNFAPITESLQQSLRDVPRCAAELFKWLRRKSRPEKAIEFSLEEFGAEMRYSVDWAKRCLKRLAEEKLISIDRQAWGYWFRVIVHDSDFHTSDRVETPDQLCESPKKQTSNPPGVVVNLKEEKESKINSEAESEPDRFAQEEQPEPAHCDEPIIPAPMPKPALTDSKVRTPAPVKRRGFGGDRFPLVPVSDDFEKLMQKLTPQSYHKWLNGDRSLALAQSLLSSQKVKAHD